MEFAPLVSRDNPRVKQYVRLARSANARAQQGLFVTQGLKLTLEAFESGCVPEALYVTQQAQTSRGSELEALAQACSACFLISQSVADKLDQSVGAQGVYGVFHMLDKRLQPVKINTEGKYILLVSMQDPGNVGTILRTAAAFGISGVFLTGDCPDPYGLKVLRAAMGGVFKVPFETTDDPCECIALLRAQGVTVHAAALTNTAVPVGQAALGSGTAVVIGNEGAGLAADVIAACSQAVIIPMRPGSESLNAATAAAVLMWEMTKPG